MCGCEYVYMYVFYICACVFNVSCAFVCTYMDVSICVCVSILVSFYSAKDLSPSLSLSFLSQTSADINTLVVLGSGLPVMVSLFFTFHLWLFSLYDHFLLTFSTSLLLFCYLFQRVESVFGWDIGLCKFSLLLLLKKNHHHHHHLLSLLVVQRTSCTLMPVRGVHVQVYITWIFHLAGGKLSSRIFTELPTRDIYCSCGLHSALVDLASRLTRAASGIIPRQLCMQSSQNY